MDKKKFYDGVTSIGGIRSHVHVNITARYMAPVKQFELTDKKKNVEIENNKTERKPIDKKKFPLHYFDGPKSSPTAYGDGGVGGNIW